MPIALFDLTVKLAEPPALTLCAAPGVTCRSDGLLEIPLIETLVPRLWLTFMVAVPSRFRFSSDLLTEIVQTTAGVGVGVAVGVGVGVAFGFPAPGFPWPAGVGVGT